MLASHYSPVARLVLCDTPEEAGNLATQSEMQGVKARMLWHEDVGEYAERLYSNLRAADEESCEVVFAVLPKADGIGLAIRDRLTKAAHHA
jgi:L-threonylcarbamoyladenylate synthase